MNRKRKNGFTLTGLLVVMAILVIIALIVGPIILNSIDKRNGEGNTGSNTGNAKMTLTDLAVDSFAVSNVDGSEPTVVTKPVCLADGTTCSPGTPVAIKVNDSEIFRFYVLKDENNEVTLIMDRNLYSDTDPNDGDVAWITKSDYITTGGTEKDYGIAGNSNKGPVTALNKLKERTAGWKNITEKSYTISGVSEDGTTQKYENMTFTSRARLITYDEATSSVVGCGKDANSCPKWLYENLYYTGDDSTSGYWTSTARLSSVDSAWRVTLMGSMHDHPVSFESYYGLRPVIELSKSLIS